MKISLIFGTRPEAIKLCPLVRALRDADGLEPHVCVTGQHRRMLDQVLEAFEVTPDVDLDLMQPDQTLPALTSRAITAIDAYLARHEPDMVIVQGDTTTVFCAALAAYYRRIPVGHVEAGLRTHQRYAPFPEELNRVLTSHLGNLHFAPTQRARENLLHEGIADSAIHVTGNTVIDALQFAADRVRRRPPKVDALPDDLQPGATGRPLVLITGHRRESFGAGFESICRALRELARRFSQCAFVYPVHLNPRVREPVARILGGIANVHLIEPLGYLPFVGLMDRARLILTDSGGVQEEAPSLGKPVLVMREVTERPEAVESGTAVLVGTDEATIVSTAARYLEVAGSGMPQAVPANPYGDGRACARIVELLQRHFAASSAAPRTVHSAQFAPTA